MIERCLPAVDTGDDGTGNCDQLRSDDVQTVVVELLFIEAFAGEAELQDGHAGGGEVDDLRGQDAGRKALEHFLGCRRDLGVGGVEGGAGLEVNLDDVFAVEAGRFGVLNVIDERGEAAFEGTGDAAFYLFGLRPVYCQATETTGILILGKISVGVRRMSTGAAIRMRIARTTKVYGRLSASRTIHMKRSPGAGVPPCMTVTERGKTRRVADNRTGVRKAKRANFVAFWICEGRSWCGVVPFGSEGGVDDS